MKGGPNPASSYGITFITNSFTNFSVQAQIQFAAGGFGGGVGGRFNSTNGTRYAAWIYPENAVGSSNVLKLIRFDSYSAFVVLQSTNLASVGTNLHTLKLEFSGNLINAYFDTNKLVSVTDATYASGSVNLEFWTDATAYQMTADNVVVSVLPLVANSDGYTAVLGIPLTVGAPGVLANDIGGNGPLRAVLATNATHGVLNLSTNGGFTYTATNNFTGTDTFAYRASDGQSNSAAAIVTITVTPDHPPVANNDAYTMLQNTALAVAAPGVLSNDTDADGNSLTAVLVSGPAYGSLTLTNNGGFSYTPTAGFAGTDSFTYKANDGLSNSANATVTISVLSIVPLFSDNFSRTNLSPWVAQSGNWAVTNGVLRGGTNSSLSYGVAYITNSWTNYSVQGSVQLPAGAFGAGLDACLNTATGARYSAWIYPEGSVGGSNTLKLIKFQTWNSFSYNGVNSSPIQSVNLASVGTGSHNLKLACAGNRIAVFFDGTLMISATDGEAQPYTNGAVGADFWTDAAGYQMSVDDFLVASLVNDDTYSVGQDTPLTVNAPGVLGNDTEIYGTSLAAVQVTGPTHGSLILATNGGFTYTPTNGYIGPDSFSYQANDGAANLGIAAVDLTVYPGGFAENFDSVIAPALPVAWTTTNTGAQTAWVTRAATNDTPPNAAYVPDPAGVGVSDLVSPVIPMGPGQSRLSFRNNYSLENDPQNPTNGFDGGVLEIRIGLGAFTDILAAGGSFVTNGYTDTISTTYNNPLAGRLAWSGNSGGFITTMVNLPAAAAGQSIQLRWRCGTDSGNGNNVTNGWYVDTVTITNCACACCWNTPPQLPTQANQTINELIPLTVNNAASDFDIPPQTLTYALINSPSGATISTNTGVISWTPSQTQSPSTNVFKAKVTDNGAPPLSSTNSFTVTVREVNLAPSLPVIASQTISELVLLTVTNTATNANIHSSVSGYQLVNPPLGVSISAGGIISWTPSQIQSPSTNTITTVVSNTNPYDLISPNLTATNSFTVVVREVNVAPALPVIPSQIVGPLSLMTVTNTAINANIHSAIVGYGLVNPPLGASISASGIITWTPSQIQTPSTNTITTVVTNTNPYDLVNPLLTATNSFTVFVYSGPVVALNSATLTAEGFFPTNNAIDPGETVGVLFSLKNLGAASTTNLVVSLLSTNGVFAPSGPQNYGVLVSGGAAVSQLFTFTASGTCGGTISPTLQLQDGAANLGSVSVTLTMGQPGIVLTQNFDTVTAPGLPGGWTSTNTGVQLAWVTRNTTNDTTPNAAYVPDPANVGTSTLVSPSISLPAGQSQLTFRNNYNLEADSHGYYDGGVLEIKVGAGAFTDILAAGGSFVSGGYNGTITNVYASSIAGRQAWSSNSAGFITTVVNLPAAAAGQSIQLRWLCATDNGNGNNLTNGWYIDSIGISGRVCSANNPPILPAQTNRTVNALTTLTVTNTANDPESPPEVLTYSLAVAPTNAVISTNGVITWTPTQEQSPSTNVITTIVRDNASPSASATNSFSVIVREVNVAPVLPVIPTQTVNELTLLTVVNTASNANIHSTIAGYALVNPPAGATIDASGVITWTAGQNQSPSTNTITTVVTNANPYDLVNPRLTATNSFTVIVREANVAPTLPVIPIQTVNELTLLTVANTASNANIHSTIVGYALVNAPAGATIDASGVITWTPGQNQSPSTNTITTVVTNANPYDLVNPRLTATNSFTVVVRELNVAPALLAIPTQSVDELTLLTVTNSASNANIHSTIEGYTLVNPPAGAAIDASGIITWTPGQNQSPSTNTITTVVTNANPYDLVNPHLAATNIFTVIVREVNLAPALPVIPTRTVDELTLLTVTNTASNSNIHSTNVGYALLNPPAGAAIDATGVITWAPGQNQSPSTNIITTVVTNANPYDLINPRLTATNSFTVIVREVNVAPVLPVILPQTIDELTLLTVTNTASNANIHSTVVGYTLVNPPSGAAIDAGGIITWTPGQSQSPSTNTITTVVANANPYDLVNPLLTATNSFTVIVREVNVAPALSVIPTQTVDELMLLTVTNTASNANIHSTIAGYTLVNPPSGAAIDASGIITWTPGQSQSPSTNTITTVVTNANPYDLVNPLLTATNSFTVIVREVNVAPALPAILPQTVDEMTLLTVTNTASNANIHSTVVGYALVNPPAGAAVDADGIITWTPGQSQSPSTNTITTVVTNANPYDLVNPHLTATNSFTVIVREVNVAPALPVIPTQTVDELTLLTVTNAASNANIHSTIVGYALVSPPAGAAIDGSGIITWTPGLNQSPSTNTITTVVSNANPYDPINPQLTATNSFTVIVKVAAVVVPPVIQSISVSNDVVTVSWSSVAGRRYQLQYQDNLLGSNWDTALPEVLATESTASGTNGVGGVGQRYYRVYLKP